MALTLSIDLNDATVADLEALLSAARNAGATSESTIRVEGSVASVTVEPAAQDNTEKAEAVNFDSSALRGEVEGIVNSGGQAIENLLGYINQRLEEGPQRRHRRRGGFGDYGNFGGFREDI